MDEKKNSEKQEILSYLKILLLHLAAKSDTPSIDLQILMREVLEELHDEVQTNLSKKKHLRLISEAIP